MSVRVLGATGGWISGLIPKESCAPSKKWWRAHQKDINFFYNIQKRGRWKSSNCDCICQLISIVRIKVTASDNRGGVSSGIRPVMLSRILRNLCYVPTGPYAKMISILLIGLLSLFWLLNKFCIFRNTAQCKFIFYLFTKSIPSLVSDVCNCILCRCT